MTNTRIPILALALALVLPPAVSGQSQSQTQTNPDGTIRVQLPTLTVTAQKEPEDVQVAPVGVTVVPKSLIDDANIRFVSDAGDYAPNVFFNEFSARKLSNARFRGVGSSPSNPGVTTYIDGVPQLNANSSSIELTDVDQIEFVRGPQSALFGRNTLGGLINITSTRPSLQGWHGAVSGPFGNFSAVDVRGSVSGPIVADKLALGFSLGHGSRDGYTVNDVTGNDLDSRSALFSKTQLLWTPASNWEARAIVTTERARDGDYALNDLDALRANPFHAARDYEGYTNRDIIAPTFVLNHLGSSIDLTATTGFVSWETEDATDLDYSPYPLATRVNNEQDLQFTQEVRVASAKARRLALTDRMTLKWQAGGSFFTQGYDQEAVNSYSPFVLSQFIGFPVSQLSPQAELDDRGFGLYGEATAGFGPKFDLSVALRGDFEHKEANLLTSYTPAIAPPTVVVAENDFNDVSPQFSAAYYLSSDHTVYGTVARGFKAGGFNPASPAGSEAYDEEHTWNYEGGLKTLWFERRMSMNATVFHLDWSDMQVNLPNPFVPGQFYVSNAAGATSTGVELEMNARLAPGCEIFAGLGYADATFGDSSISGGVPVAGNRISNTPNYTADFGGQYTVALNSSVNVYGRADISFKGGMYYDDANTEQQDAYSLSNFRAGVRGRQLFAEAWLRNAFDTEYVPLAFAYPGLAPSGFVGENGAPRTFGVRAGVSF